MTILPKKKPTKDKNDPENTDHSHHSSANESRHEKVGRSRSSPTRWLPASTSFDDKRDSGGSSYDGHDSSSNHNKRRHRSSPHRNVRKHRHDPRGSHHPPTSSSSHVGVVGGGTVPGAVSVGVAVVGNGSSPSDYESMTGGYNSEDEHAAPGRQLQDNTDELEHWFEATLKEKKGFIVKKMREDGACLFRAVADQVFGDPEMHSDVRKTCIDYMAKNVDYFKHYVTEDFNTYLNRKRMDSCHGNHVEMQALCELYNRPIEVYQYSIDPINTFHSAYKTDNEPIRISYHRNVHYNSVVDPFKATIGVGLGLPGLQPGLAEKNLMRDAVTQSEDFHIEKAMLEDKLRETDWELTQETIEEQVARESYLQWLRDNEKRAKIQGPARSASATCSSSSEYALIGPETVASPDCGRLGRSPRHRSASNSTQSSPHSAENCIEKLQSQPSQQPLPQQHCSPNRPTDLTLHSGSPKSPQIGNEPLLGAVAAGTGGSCPTSDVASGGFDETASIMNRLPPTMFGLTEWDEDDILAQVIAQSQQEYLDSLKKNAASTSVCDSLPMDQSTHSSS
ncbi:OTUD5 [Acanthosepion pharaonis]|uniref:ubiquitinyl hydrolase 1 n=1 Tax=Acanthosepion pharaonis TaxID=158019 RepID=A0A812DLY9_ACAPH|nr:OTUD5 [Sepia pharaonis]